MLTRIDHIGIAVESIENALPFYRDSLEMPLAGIEDVTEQKVRVAMLRTGESKVELLEPTSPDSPIAKFLEKNGEGIHHIAYAVDDIGKALEKLAKEGVRLIDAVPRKGAHGAMIAFVHPKNASGVLSELCQSSSLPS